MIVASELLRQARDRLRACNSVPRWMRKLRRQVGGGGCGEQCEHRREWSAWPNMRARGQSASGSERRADERIGLAPVDLNARTSTRARHSDPETTGDLRAWFVGAAHSGARKQPHSRFVALRHFGRPMPSIGFPTDACAVWRRPDAWKATAGVRRPMIRRLSQAPPGAIARTYVAHGGTCRI